MYQLEERDREIQEAKRQAAKLPQIAAQLYIAEHRIEKLEQLCRDLYREGCYYWLLTNNDPPYARSAWCDDFCSCMEELGLLEGEN